MDEKTWRPADPPPASGIDRHPTAAAIVAQAEDAAANAVPDPYATFTPRQLEHLRFVRWLHRGRHAADERGDGGR